MTDKQQRDFIELNSLISIMEKDIDWSTFETKYKQIKSKLKDIIDDESDFKLKAILNQKLVNIISFETKAKGVNIAQDLYDKSVKPKATKKSKSEFESKYFEVKNHILYDLNDFIDSTPND